MGIQGVPGAGLGGWPLVVLTRGESEAEAQTLYFHPGGLGHGRSWVVRLPASLEEGDYCVRVRVLGECLEAGALHVAEASASGADDLR